jgi:O-antigen/teichoic acid export membrane protein
VKENMILKFIVNLSPLSKLFSRTNLPIIINSGSLVATTLVTSGLGFFFWWLAARRFSPEAVGFASTIISAMMLLGTIGVLGFGTLLMGELPRQPGKEKSLISTAIITVGLAGGVLGILFAVMSPWLSPDFRVLVESLASISLFSSGVCLTAMALVIDQALIGLLRGGLQFWRNVIMAGVKLGALLVAGLWFTNRSGLTIYVTWAIGNLLSFVMVAFLVWPKQWNLNAYLPQWGLLRKLGRLALGHHALNLALQVPGLVLPILVTSLLSVRMNAYFYTAWMVANLIYAGPTALATVLYAVVAADHALLKPKTRLTLKFSLLIGLIGSAFLMIGSEWILSFFGASYAKEAGWSLRILGLGIFPLIIRAHFVTIFRIFNRLVYAARIISLCALFELTLAVIGAKSGGLSGLTLGWVISIYIEAAFMAATVLRAVGKGDIEG